MTAWDNNDYTQFIKPPGAYPEGFDVAQYLQILLYRFGILPPQDHNREVIIDMFCGKGRLCEMIPIRHAHVYRGVDINEAAIGDARAAYPYYDFLLMDGTQHRWQALAIVMWTAISMLDDDAVAPFLNKLDAQYVIIGEICGRDWRHAGSVDHPPIYNRNWHEYPDLMKAAGYELSHHEMQPHAHYSSGQWSGRDTNMHTFIFRKDDAWKFYKEARIR